MKAILADRMNLALLAVAVLGLMCGLGLLAAGRSDAADLAFSAGVILVLAALMTQILHSLARREVGLDIVAALSMSAALIFGETLAAAVVALMYSGGTFLEGFAAGRARREMTDLLSRVPRTATLHRDDGLVEVALDRIGPGDLLLIRQGAVAPVDGTVAGPVALLDQSALTGESMPLRRTQGQEVMSGPTNLGRCVRPARHPSRRRQHLCRHSPPRGDRAGVQDADVASGRPVFDAVPGGHGDPGDRRVVGHGRSDPRGGGPGRGNALSAEPCQWPWSRGCRGQRIMAC